MTAASTPLETEAAPARPALNAWVLAIRPKTLVVSVVPVMVATALAFRHRTGRWAPALAALAGAVLIQIGTNLVNDYYDFFKGADRADRVGPIRVTQSGLLSPEAVLAGAILTFSAALTVGVYLVGLGGWPIAIVGLASLLAGYTYTGGPYPLGYHGLGDLFVFVFFGLAAVAGTYYVQAGTLPRVIWAAAIPIGALATAVLVANNLRDRVTDAKANKRTLVVRLGERAGRIEYVALLALAFIYPLLRWALTSSHWTVLLPLLTLPLAGLAVRRVLRESGSAVAPALGETARLEAAFGALWALGLWLGA